MNGSAWRLELYWIPLGAGERLVRRSGHLYERLSAARHHRAPSDLYHSALIATTPGGRYTIEMTPVPDAHGAERGVVAEGAVGSPLLGRWRVFRYEIRRWLGGEIPDLPYAVASPVLVSHDAAVVEDVLELVAQVPTPTWGRHELYGGDMWNSNSVISWTLVRAGALVSAGAPPAGGRAPGWDAGVIAAQRRNPRPYVTAVTDPWPSPLDGAGSPCGARRRRSATTNWLLR